LTPAVRVAEAAGVTFELLCYEHDPGAESFGLEAARRLDQPPGRIFKTLLARLDGARLAVAILPVQRRLDLKALATAVGSKRARLAEAPEAERATGYVVGGISPLGQRRRLPTFVDDSALPLPRIYVSGGRRGLEIGLAPADLARLTQARFAAIAR
jgi:Cys-tRNA(Pro)/Cys-tRNA(Cys) deacylase